MLEKLNEKIANVKENIDVLPKKTKANRIKLNEYIDSELNEANKMNNMVIEEINNRISSITNKYSQSEISDIASLDVKAVRNLSIYNTSLEKMNLSYYFYVLDHFYNNDLDKINTVILKILASFEVVGIKLTSNDFNYTDSVNTYMSYLLGKKNGIHEVFDKLYWQNSNLITQIELNFRYLYWKNIKTIDKFYTNYCAENNIDNYINEYIKLLDKNKNILHTDKGYLYNLFMSNKYQTVDFNDKNIETLKNGILLKEDNNYDNLIKLLDELEDYKLYLKYKYIIDDVKNLYKDKESYKTLLMTNLKDISKKEGELFKINKKLQNKGLFKVKENVLNELKLKRDNIISEIKTLYNDNDEILIKDKLFKNVKDDTSYIEVLKLVSGDFHYMAKLLKTQNENITIEEMSESLKTLYTYIYGNKINTLSNICISEEKDIPYIIKDRFRLSNINFNLEDLELDNIDSLIEKITKLITYYDLLNNSISMSDIEFILKCKKLKLIEE